MTKIQNFKQLVFVSHWLTGLFRFQVSGVRCQGTEILDTDT